MKKFKLTGETKAVKIGSSKKCRILHRIQALRNFADIRVGELGGWVEKESNLSQHGNCWIEYNGEVSGESRVCDNARIIDEGRVLRGVLKDDAVVISGGVIDAGFVIGNDEVITNWLSRNRYSSQYHRIKRAMIEDRIAKEVVATDGRKYEFTGKTMEYQGHTLRQIRLLRYLNREHDFYGHYENLETNGEFEAGTIGGWIESESNLSHEGNCWITKKSMVFGDAVVRGDANVACSTVFENAVVEGNATLWDVTVNGHAIVKDNAKLIYGGAGGHAKLLDNACVHGTVLGKTIVKGDGYVDILCTVKAPVTITMAVKQSIRSKKQFIERYGDYELYGY